MAETEITWETVTDLLNPNAQYSHAECGLCQAGVSCVGGERWGWQVIADMPGLGAENQPLFLEVLERDAFPTEAEARAHAEAVMRRMNAWREREQANG